MPGNLLHLGFNGVCPHGGTIQPIQTSARVRINRQPALRLADACMVTGCTFTVPPGKPQPCMKVQWVVGAQHVRIEGQPALLSTSFGLCQSAEQIPQGPPNVMSSQTQVRGQ